MEAPIYVLYGVNNFYQNYLTYMSSRDVWQLMGYDSEPTCVDGEFSVAEDGRDYLPCGLQAHSMFNDTIELLNDDVTMDETDISWESDRNVRFQNPENYPETCEEDSLCLSEAYPGIIAEEDGQEDEHFIVWMRLNALPFFRKRYATIEQDLEPNQVLTFEIENNFPVTSFDGAKMLILSTSSWIGGKNVFLGASLVTFGILNLVMAVAISLKEHFCPRVLVHEDQFNDLSISLLPGAGPVDLELSRAKMEAISEQSVVST